MVGSSNFLETGKKDQKKLNSVETVTCIIKKNFNNNIFNNIIDIIEP